jgi:hypothetical protein
MPKLSEALWLAEPASRFSFKGEPRTGEMNCARSYGDRIVAKFAPNEADRVRADAISAPIYPAISAPQSAPQQNILRTSQPIATSIIHDFAQVRRINLQSPGEF